MKEKAGSAVTAADGSRRAARSATTASSYSIYEMRCAAACCITDSNMAYRSPFFANAAVLTFWLVAQFLRGGNASFLSYIISTPFWSRSSGQIWRAHGFRTPHHGPHFGIGTVSCVVAAALCLASFGYPTPTIAYILTLLAVYVSLVRMHLLGSGNAAHDVPLSLLSLRCVFSRRLAGWNSSFAFILR